MELACVSKIKNQILKSKIEGSPAAMVILTIFSLRRGGGSFKVTSS